MEIKRESQKNTLLIQKKVGKHEERGTRMRHVENREQDGRFKLDHIENKCKLSKRYA